MPLRPFIDQIATPSQQKSTQLFPGPGKIFTIPRPTEVSRTTPYNSKKLYGLNFPIQPGKPGLTTHAPKREVQVGLECLGLFAHCADHLPFQSSPQTLNSWVAV